MSVRSTQLDRGTDEAVQSVAEVHVQHPLDVVASAECALDLPQLEGLPARRAGPAARARSTAAAPRAGNITARVLSLTRTISTAYVGLTCLWSEGFFGRRLAGKVQDGDTG